MSNNLGIKIRTMLAAKGLKISDLVEGTGISRQSIYYWLNGKRKPDAENLKKVAAFLNVDAESLTNSSDEFSKVSMVKSFHREDELPPGVVEIKEYELAFSAGPGSEPTWEEATSSKRAWYREEFFVDHRINANRCRRATVSGDSMEPLIRDGDKILIVEEPVGTPIRDGDVYALCIGGTLKVKRLSRRSDGTLVIRSENPLYTDEILTIPEQESIYILGRVIEVTHII